MTGCGSEAIPCDVAVVSRMANKMGRMRFLPRASVDIARDPNL